jgi:glycosyltransferase involved in cell wall biosynthesis
LRVLCLSTWPSGTAPAVRFRCEVFFPLLARHGILVDQASFFTGPEYSVVKTARSAATIGPILRGFVRRLATIGEIRVYDAVWLLREAAPVGPPILEQIIARVLGKPIVFDFDDAAWLPGKDESVLEGAIRWRSKIKATIRASAAVIAGNEFLAAFARQFNPRTTIIPTCVDTDSRYTEVHEHVAGHRPVIGWTGSHSTNGYLTEISEVLTDLRRSYDFGLTIISDRKPDFPFPDFTYRPWRPESEICDLRDFDIGIMPLRDTIWEKGKCSLKLVQYMALGIPAVASAVGTNADIVRHGIDGFVCDDDDDWRRALVALLADPAMRAEMGRNARSRIDEHFSVGRQVDRLAGIFRTAAAGANARRPAGHTR